MTERDGRGAIAWPDGARCAAAVTFDIDCDSILHLDRPTQGYRRVGTQSWLRYDEVAVPAILDLYERLGLKQTFFVPGWCVERYPDLVRQIIESGHELAAHGYQHELAHELDPARERALMERSIEAVVQAGDRRPRGWRGPLYSFSDRTAEFLVEEGFTYDSTLMAHHLPHRLHTPAGELLELPCDWASDDWPQYAVAPDFDWVVGVRSPDRAFESFEAEFEAAYAHGGLWTAIWHPFVSGRPARLARIERFLRGLIERGDVWLAAHEDIADHLNELAGQGRWDPARVSVPFDASPPWPRL